MIIENQLEPTDHGHLGQLMTYAAGLKANAIIWIAPQFRDEHREAIDWLNEVTGEAMGFFAVELEVLEINGQRAPHFRVVAAPNVWQKSRAIATSQRAGGQPGELHIQFQEFFANLLEELKARRSDITRASRTQPENWFAFAAGVSGAYFAWSFPVGGKLAVELTVDTADAGVNRQFMDELQTNAHAMERQLDTDLTWELSDSRRAQRVRVFAPFANARDVMRERPEELRDWAVPMMIRFVDVMRPRVKDLLA